MKYRWALRPVEHETAIPQLQQALNNLPEALARILAMRGVETFEKARHFFRPSLTDLHDPFLMKDMDIAANRITEALKKHEKILVYGDYDVDGTTSTALMTSFLRDMGADVGFFIPDRIKDGYGLGPTGIDFAAEQGATLIVALDCGITAHKEAEYARSKGIDLIICDHHKAGETIPNALAVLDPKRPDCEYPFKELCGCGVGFKLLQAVLKRLGKADDEAFRYLDLVAIATASDIVPVNGENRVLMGEGFRRFAQTERIGLKKLAQFARFDLSQPTTSKLVFQIGPRINAAGRMGDAQRASRLLMTDDQNEADQLAQELEKDNEHRRVIDQETLNQAQKMAERQITSRERHTIVLHDENWHPGVIGIVASRIVERLYRPTILLTSIDGVAKGSARSITGINIYDALKGCEDLLIQFGGHDYAAGMALKEENIPAFQQRFDEMVGATVTADLLQPVLEIDAALNLQTLDRRFWAVLKQFAPFGPTNRTPVFHARDLQIMGEPKSIGKDRNHVKFNVRQRGESHTPFSVIGFNMGQHLNALRKTRAETGTIELAFCIEENNWNGNTSLQLRARDLRVE